MPASPEFVRVWNLWQASEDAIQNIRDLHHGVRNRYDHFALCNECVDVWPCPTVKIIDELAAARGGANCAHARTQYTREVCWCGDAVDVCDDCGVDVHECADGADAGNRNASVPEDATPHAASTNPDSAPRGERGDGEQA